MRRLLWMMSLLALLTVAVLAQGPLPVLENVHAVLPPFSVVSRNGELGEEPTPLMVNGRRLEVPRGWSYTGTPGVGALPPFIARYDQPGYRLDVSWINGTAGFAQDGIQLYGRQRYVVRVQYRTALEYTSADYPWVPSDVQVVGRLYTANSGLLELPPFNMAGLAETATVEWVIESTANPYPFVRLEVLFNVQYPIFRGFVFFDRIEVLTAPADYKPDFVIAFQ